MRDYTGLNYCYAKKYLNDAINSTKHNYKRHFNTQDVPGKYHYLKNQSLSVGDDANSHIASIRSRLSTALDLLETFHKDVDTASSSICSSADNIVAILNEVNGAMDRINNALSGLGDYKGKTISANDIKSAGIDESKCERLKKKYYDTYMDNFLKNQSEVDLYIEEMKALKEKNGALSPADYIKLKYIFEWYAKNQFDSTGKATLLTDQQLRNFVDVFELLRSADLTDKMLDDFMKNEDAVALYIEDMKTIQKNGSLSPEDIDKLEKVYGWYVNNRYGSTKRLEDMTEEELKRLIEVYELLDPKAKEVTDDFFKDAYKKNDANVNLNILRIKYTLYTSDPDLRDTMLYYLKDIEFSVVENGGGYCSKKIELDLLKNDGGAHNCYAFFHELGHAIDDLSCPDGDSSEALTSDIVNDVRTLLTDEIKKYNSSLSDYEITMIVNYFLNTKINPNIVRSKNDTPSLPFFWNENQKDAYLHVRDLFGYYNYVYDNYSREDHAPTSPLMTRGKNGIIIDMLEGVTNNKIGGGIGGGHPYSWDANSTKPPKYSEFKRNVRQSYYYCDPDDPKADPLYDTEFFAEVFEYKVLGTELNTTGNVFKTAVPNAEKLISDICKNAH